LRGKFYSVVAASLFALFAAGRGGGASGESDTLRVGLIPNQNPEEVEAQYEPHEEYLAEELGGKVEVSVPTTYNAVVESLVSGKLDLAYFGGHDTTAQAVVNGRVDAGGLEDRILADLEKEGIVDEGKIRVVQESEPIEGYPWVVRDALSDDREEEITSAFLNIEDPKLLDLLRADVYEKVGASDYDDIEKQAKSLDLLAEEQ